MNWQERDLKHIWHPCSQMKDYVDMPPIVVEKAEGIYLYDEFGKKYMDVVSSWWCNLLGHCNNRISNAVKKQLDSLEHVIFCNFSHKPAIILAEKLTEILPTGLVKFNFTDNGSSCIEAAMKMSFQYHFQTGNKKKNRFMALTDAYHGETVGALSVCGCDEYSQIYKPMLLDVIRVQAPDCYRCPYNFHRDSCNAECFCFAEKAFDEFGEQACAFLAEPLLQGAAGMRVYPPAYLKKLRKACDSFDVHMIADEIATGFGRTGKMFACDYAGVTPDIMCISKGLTGGYLPMAIAAVTQKIYDAFYADYSQNKAFLHSHTYSGNPLACAAAIEVLDILQQENILETANENAVYFNKSMCGAFLNKSYVGEVRSIGLINAIELVKDIKTKEPFDKNLRVGRQVYKKALELGLVLKPLGDILYFNPPLTMVKSEMDWAIKTCLKAIDYTVSKL